jgi:hypothetical protein
MNNRCQAVRLPQEFQFNTHEVFIRKQGGRNPIASTIGLVLLRSVGHISLGVSREMNRRAAIRRIISSASMTSFISRGIDHSWPDRSAKAEPISRLGPSLI